MRQKEKEPDLQDIRGLILDMDGVLWRGAQPIGDLPAIFTRLRAIGCKVVLATNNSTRTISQYLQRVQSFGVTLETWQVVNSSQAAVNCLHRLYPQGGPLFIIGEPALHSTLATAGFHHSEDHPQAVLAGMDWSITYDKLRRATLLIRSGLPFIATNPDRTFPTPEGLVPGTGALLAALQAATDVTPQIAGKPSPEMYRIAIERMGIGIEQTLVVGDRAETDIAGAQALGCRTALVLSGVTDLAAAQAWRPAPDLIAEDLTQVVEQLGAL